MSKYRKVHTRGGYVRIPAGRVRGGRTSTRLGGNRRGGGSLTIRVDPQSRLRLRSKMRLRSRTATLTQQVKKIKEKQEWCCADKATHIHRWSLPTYVHHAANKQSHSSACVLNHANLHTAMDGMRMFNPQDGLMKTIDIGDKSFNQLMQVNNIYQKAVLRNNGTSPVEYDCYWFTCKTATNNSPADTWTAGIADQCTTVGADYNDLNHYPTDSEPLKRLWRLEKHKHGRLEPGATATTSRSTGKFSFSPSQADESTLTYQKYLKSSMCLVVTRGIMAHGSADHTIIGTTAGHVEIMGYIKYEFEYDAGIALKDYSVNNQSFNILGTDYAMKPAPSIGIFAET